MRNQPDDLSPYDGCGDEAILGFVPLAVGFLSRQRPFPTGKTPPDFAGRLLAFCLPEHTVCRANLPARCPLGGCPPRLPPVRHGDEEMELTAGEIRVMGEEEIYAAPSLIYHYVVAHGYRPPDGFVEAVRHGPRPGSDEHRALVRTLNAGRR
jgi:hypothetical protein